MEEEYAGVAAETLDSMADLVFVKLALLVVASSLGAVAICLAAWPRILPLFVAEAMFSCAMALMMRRVVMPFSQRVTAMSDGLARFARGDRAFRFAAEEGTPEDALNMWMDAVDQAGDVGADLAAISSEAANAELIADAMLNGIAPRDADMILGLRESLSRIRAVVSSREAGAER